MPRKSPPDFIYLLRLQAPKWSEIKYYQPKVNGDPPKALLDELTFWAPKPWVHPDKQSKVKTTVYKYMKGPAVQLDFPDPVPIHLILQ